MGKKKLSRAKSFQGLMSLLARYPGEAVISGRTSDRVYQTPSGPWDAEIVDHVLSEIQRFLEDGSLSNSQIGLLHWDRSGIHWSLGSFDEAASDVERAISIYELNQDSRKVVENMRKALNLIREHRGPLEMLD